MRRRKVAILIEAETVMTIKELRQLSRMVFDRGAKGEDELSRDPDDEGKCMSLGTITQVQVNVITK